MPPKKHSAAKSSSISRATRAKQVRPSKTRVLVPADTEAASREMSQTSSMPAASGMVSLDVNALQTVLSSDNLASIFQPRGPANSSPVDNLVDKEVHVIIEAFPLTRGRMTRSPNKFLPVSL